MMDFDEMLVQVGEFGIYQKALFVFQAPFCMFVTFILFGQLFMTLYPRTIWCDDHFNCVHGNMTPMQRQNLTFAYTMGAFDPCFVQNFDSFHDPPNQRRINVWDTAVVKAIVDWINGTSQGRNYTERFTNESKEVSDNVSCAQTLLGLPVTNVNPSQCNRVRSPSPETFRQKRQKYGGYGGGGYGGGGAWRTTTTPEPHSTNSKDIYNTGPGDYSSAYGGSQGGWGSASSQGGNNGWGGQGSYPSGGRDRTPTQGSRGSSGSGQPQGGQSGWGPSNPNWEGPRPQPEGGSPTGGAGGSPGSGRGSNGNAPFGETSLSTDERTQANCTRSVNVALRNTSFIFLLERDPNGPTSAQARNQSNLQPGSRANERFIPVERCRNVTWERRYDRNNPNAEAPYDTIVTEGMWWCNAELYNTVSTAIFFVGAIVGGFLIGWIADSYGRVPALVVANLLGAIGGALSVSTTNFYLFAFFRFITGMAFDNCFTMMYILVLEFCGPTYRTLVANLSIAVFYTLGTILLPVLAQLIGNWRIYGLVISLPMLLGLFAIFLVPESARWLLSKGRTAEATNILRSFAKVNRKQVDESVFVAFEQDAQTLFDSMKESEEEEASFLTALKTPRLRKTFMLLVAIWSFIALVYDGHSRNILNLANEQWSVFTMFMIASMTEFPADVLLIFTLDRFGRRWLSFGALTLSGAASIIAAAVPPDVSFTATLVLAMVARFFVNVAFNIGLQYAAELLPTVIRAQGVNAIHIMGYVASIISPVIASIGRTNRALSLILLGAVSIAGGFLSLFLAETLGEDLPNTLEEAENFGKNQSFWNCPICAPPRDEYERPPETLQEEDIVVRRNKWRSSNTGAIYRSSIISHSRSSRGSGGRHGGIALDPIPSATETTNLRRITR